MVTRREGSVPGDDRLVRQAQDGRVSAFDTLMLRYEKLVCKVAIGYVKDKQSALDVTQNVFLKAFLHLDRVTNDWMFKPWLLRITHNESINWLRRHSRDPFHDDATELELPAVDVEAPEAGVLRKESERLVADGLARLNPKYRTALSLRYAEGMKIKDIASARDCSEGMVKSLLFRGVRQIRDRVARSA